MRRPGDVRELCTLYGIIGDAERERLLALAREGKQQAWWQSYDLPYATYIGLEAVAASIKHYDSDVVPGLLQTPDYTRARHEGAMPRLDAAEIERRVEVTTTRQALLKSANPPHFWSILDEAVLHRVVGNPGVMKAQLDRPDRGFRPAKDHYPGNPVYYRRSIYLERPEDLDRYQLVFNRLSSIALSPEDSIAMVQRVHAAM